MVDKDAHYLMNKCGVFYLTRHVPNDLQCHYARPCIVICLKTRSKNSVLKASHSLASKLNEFRLEIAKETISRHPGATVETVLKMMEKMDF